ncbi:MAG: hypothetical protein HY754_11260 [Nitrospirae bacterium]|nr:hypothetical protein [Nitrospirota bacterium]
MKRKLILFVSIAITIIYWFSDKEVVFAASEKQNWWLEIGGDIGYQKTDFWFEDQQHFGKSVMDARGGYRFYISDYLFVDPYLRFELLGDLGGEEQNKFFWNNNLRYGPGIRVRAEHKIEYKVDEEHAFRFNYANLDYYAEYLHISFIDRGQDIPDNIPRNDFRTGFNSWISADSSSKLSEGNLMGGIWFEMWSDLTYHTTNFFLENKDNFCILTLSPKVGLRGDYHGIALEPYYRLDYVHDFLNEDWNKEAWSNNTKYGPGIRLSLGGLTKRTDTSIYLYTEYLNIDFDSRVGSKSSGLSTNDFRAGLNLWIPFGASKGSQGRI